MKTFHTNDRFMAYSYADMINEALGTNFTSHQKSGVKLDDFGLSGVIAWFVFMDGSVHGYEDDYKWKNTLSCNKIKEELVSKDHSYVIGKFDKEGYYPYRLAFEICEHGEAVNGGRHSCRFVGAYTFSNFLRKDLTSRLFVKVSNDFILKSKGEYGKILNKKEDFIKGMPKLYTPVESMGFTPNTLRILKSGKISNAGKLLELGVDCKEPIPIIDEIHNKLYEFFGKEDNDEADLPVEHKEYSPQPTQEAVMLEPEIYVGMAVIHQKYGDGKIVKIDDTGKYINVGFSDTEKEFLFPGCFEHGFLKTKSNRRILKMNIAEINLEEGMPTCDEAMDRLRFEIKLAKQSGYKCVVFIHGYGSSGKGGAIRLKARQWLNAQVRGGKLKSVVNGEDFNILNNKARELREKFSELEPLLRVSNHGVTVVEL